MNIIKKIIFVATVMIFFSCGDDPLSPAEISRQEYLSKTRIQLEMSNELELKISIKNFNFQYPANILGFELIYNPDVISLISQASGVYGDPSFLLTDDNTDYTSVAFIGDLKGSGELIKFQFEGSDSDYEYTTIFLRWIIIFDSRGDRIHFEENEFIQESVCYIDRHPTNGEEFGSFSWRKDYCYPLNYDQIGI